MKFKSRLDELVYKIKEARVAYYNNTSKVSDQVFDAWISELSKLDPFHKELVAVGSEPVSNWEKHTHNIPMGSLNKVNTFDELKSWADKFCKSFFLTHKLDGLSLSLIYEDGLLIKAITRGSGEVGEDIFVNVMKIPNVPRRIDLEGTVHIRGEIMFELQEFEKFKAEYSNPRNAASGISRRYDGTNSESLRFYAYQIFCEDLDIASEMQQFEMLEKMHFTVPDHYLLSTIEEVEKFRNSLDRSSLAYEIDGLVIRENDLNLQKKHGDTHMRPKAAIAYKFDADGAETTITSIDFQVGSTGVITPVAYFEPVELEGAKLKKCSLYNFDYVKQLGLNVGAKVLVIRANGVIPRIQECIEPNGETLEAPKLCPECQSPTEFVGSYLKCTKPADCIKAKKEKIMKFVSNMNILEWGDKLIDQLFEKKLVNKISDLYSLTADQLASLDRMGEKSAERCLSALNERKSISLERFLGSIGIPGINESTFKLIVDAGYNTFDKIVEITEDQLNEIKGLGEVKSKSIVNFFASHSEETKNIYKHLDIIIKGTKLAGKGFCFTGSFKDRKALEELVGKHGGTLKGSVGSSTNYLITNDTTSGSSKNKKAQELNIPILSEGDFLKLVT